MKRILPLLLAIALLLCSCTVPWKESTGEEELFGLPVEDWHPGSLNARLATYEFVEGFDYAYIRAHREVEAGAPAVEIALWGDTALSYLCIFDLAYNQSNTGIEEDSWSVNDIVEENTVMLLQIPQWSGNASTKLTYLDAAGQKHACYLHMDEYGEVFLSRRWDGSDEPYAALEDVSLVPTEQVSWIEPLILFNVMTNSDTVIVQSKPFEIVACNEILEIHNGYYVDVLDLDQVFGVELGEGERRYWDDSYCYRVGDDLFWMTRLTVTNGDDVKRAICGLWVELHEGSPIPFTLKDHSVLLEDVSLSLAAVNEEYLYLMAVNNPKAILDDRVFTVYRSQADTLDQTVGISRVFGDEWIYTIRELQPSGSYTHRVNLLCNDLLDGSGVEMQYNFAFGTVDRVPAADPGKAEEPHHPMYLWGSWHAGNSVGAGYADRYLFEEDGTFTYAANQHTGAERMRYTTGSWWVQSGVLYLSAKSLLMVEGGVEIEGYASMINDIEGGEYVRYDLAPEDRVIEEYPIANIGSGEDSWMYSSILLGDIQLWKMNVTTYDMYEFKEEALGGLREKFGTHD